MSDQFTFMVKTLLRPHCLEALLGSIRNYYPFAPIYVADDSPESYSKVGRRYNVDVYKTFPYDIGIGTCYNWIIDNAKTPYIVLLDDDFVFTEHTKVEKFIPFLESGWFDLVGGEVWNPRRRIFQGFCGHFTTPGAKGLTQSTIHLRKIPRGSVKGPAAIEVTMNFFMARTEVLQDVRWDPDLKVCRHEDFFLRFSGFRPREPRVQGYKAAFWPGVIVNHEHQSGPASSNQKLDYAWHRRTRFPEFREKFVEKWGFEFV